MMHTYGQVVPHSPIQDQGLQRIGQITCNALESGIANSGTPGQVEQLQAAQLLRYYLDRFVGNLEHKVLLCLAVGCKTRQTLEQPDSESDVRLGKLCARFTTPWFVISQQCCSTKVRKVSRNMEVLK